ncbi:MAG: hypothetical protein PQJ46_04640 [Spirochaetales bacterium]|nr:hypothetical protein [Spirochaetales bacterium]
MKMIILCPKSSGNTYTVVKNVSERLKIEQEVINPESRIDISKYDVLILSSGVYMDQVHKSIRNWVSNLPEADNPQSPRFYLFMTWLGRGKSNVTAFNDLKNQLGKKGYTMDENYTDCFGKSFGVIRREHPNETDFEKIMNWIENI